MGKKNQNIPKLRFEGYSDVWKQQKMKDIAIMHARIGWQNLRTSEFLEQGDYYLVTGTDFDNGTIDFEHCHYVGKNRFDQDENIQLTPGSILITKDGTLGKIAYVRALNKPATLNAGVFNVLVRDDSDVDSVYLFQYLRAPFLMDFVTAGATGGTIKHLNQSLLVNFPVNSPSYGEQKKIGSALSNLDSLITFQQRKLSKLQDLKKALLVKLFPAEGENVPAVRFGGYEGIWEQRKLGDMADIIGGGTPDTKNPTYWGGDINWYSPAELDDRVYVESSERKITEDGYNNSSAKMLPVGTVLFTSRAGIGKSAILTNEACTNQGFQSIVPHEDELDSYFIFSRTAELKEYGETIGAGSTFAEVSGKQMAAMELLMPPSLDEQESIGALFKDVDTLITLHQRKLSKLKDIKKALLNEMFPGGDN